MFNLLKTFLIKLLLLITKKLSSFIAQEKVNVVIKIDAIGDYILFRNFLNVLKSESEIQNRKLVFVGNLIIKELYESLDSDSTDYVIWLDRQKFLHSKFYRYLFLLRFNRYSIIELIQPTHSRDNIVNFLFKYVVAETKISCSGDSINIPSEELLVSNNIFDTIIHTDSNLIFEFDRNKNFFEQICNRSHPVDIKLNAYLPTQKLDHFSFFIGASNENKCLTESQWKLIFDHILKKYNTKIKLIGGYRERDIGERLARTSDRLVNLCGLLSLTESMKIIASGEATFTNDSSGLHMAMAVSQEPVFCFTNTVMPFRFVPYPRSYKNLKCFFPEGHICEEKQEYNEGMERNYPLELISMDKIDIQTALIEIDKRLRSRIKEKQNF